MNDHREDCPFIDLMPHSGSFEPTEQDEHICPYLPREWDSDLCSWIGTICEDIRNGPANGDAWCRLMVERGLDSLVERVTLPTEPNCVFPPEE